MLVVWQVAHCCLNSVAPSGGLTAGKGICAPVICTASIALQNPSPNVHLARSFVIYITASVR
jgi:hypothetical protein